MKKKLRFFSLLAALQLACNSVTAFESSRESVTAMGITMPYRKCVVVQKGATEKPALVVYLHGGSSKGNDNDKPILEPGTDSIANYLSAHDMNAIFLVPQCPSDKSWGGPMNAVLKALIEQYTANGLADTDRVYIFGGSMGGTGTWGMLSAYPNLFAAAMPVAANPSKCVAENVAKTPAFTVMGTADAIMKVQTATDFVEQLKALGDDVVMETEEGWTHEVTCIESYTTRRLDWVFAHRRNTVSGILTTTDGWGDKVVSRMYFTTDGKRVDAPSASHIYVVKEVLQNGEVTTRKSIF